VGRKSWRDVWRRDETASAIAVGPPTLTPDTISLETIIFVYLTYTRIMENAMPRDVIKMLVVAHICCSGRGPSFIGQLQRDLSETLRRQHVRIPTKGSECYKLS
jgi:hypothetical protein